MPVKYVLVLSLIKQVEHSGPESLTCSGQG